MNHQERPSNLKNTGGKTALERLCDRESLRTLSLVQGMIFEELCQSETRHLETIWRNYALRKLICYYDQLLTSFEDAISRRDKRNSAADVRPDGRGGSDDQ